MNNKECIEFLGAIFIILMLLCFVVSIGLNDLGFNDVSVCLFIFGLIHCGIMVGLLMASIIFSSDNDDKDFYYQEAYYDLKKIYSKDSDFVEYNI